MTGTEHQAISDLLDTKLRPLREDVTAIKLSLAACQAERAHCRAQVAEHRETLYGNGKDGLKADVQDLKTVSRVKRWVIGTLLAAVGVVIGGLGAVWAIFEWAWRAKGG